MLIDACLADMLFARCEQELSYHRRLRDAIDGRMDVLKQDPGSRCRFYDRF